MTFVIARRQNRTVSFLSDSRISFGEQGYFDQGGKIFQIPVRIRGPLKVLENKEKWEFELVYGMAVAGSAIATYSIKDSLVEILRNIQYITNTSDLSIVGIGTYVFQKYADISEKLRPVLRGGAMSEIVLGGWCLHEGRTRVIRLFPVLHADGVSFSWEEILYEDGTYFMGTGADDAKKLTEDHPDYTPLRIIKEVIDSKVNKTVGGYLQFGQFIAENFRLSGVREEIQTDDGQGKTQLTHFIGFDLNAQNIHEYPRLFIPHSIVDVDWKPPVK